MENKKPRNPNAFPTPMETGYEYNEEGLTIGSQEGMTLRDYFANSAMQGLLSSYIGSSDVYKDISYNAKTIASHSYSLADAMLKEREKQ